MAFVSRTEIEERGIDYDDLVSFVANELDEGAVQGIFTAEQLDAGAHYDEAMTMLSEFQASDLIAKFITR